MPVSRKPWIVGAVSAAALVVALAAAAGFYARSPSAHADANPLGQNDCIGRHPQSEIYYAANCSGHDEPEIDPVSNHPGSAQDITWTIVLPSNGAAQVDQVGPTFWIGGTVTDPKSLLGQAFLEVQFYPNSTIKSCSLSGGFNVTNTPGAYTVCSPVWKVEPTSNKETSAFNAMLMDGASNKPLVMHAGDTVTDHQYVTPAADGMHITITDLTTGHSGTIILNSSDGPLMPAFDKQQIGNSLGWGLVNDTPNSLVWEIGHTSPYATKASQFCLPGSATNPPCYSYDVPTWLQFQPLQIKGVTFGDGSAPQNWAAVSDYGGKAEVDQYCGAANYGQPFCTYPFFAYQAKTKAYTYGGDYPGTTKDFNGVLQFAQTTDCSGPFGPNSTYCDTILQ
ncbi:MAG TPA: hypothetical protein VHR15_20560 [Ktedonobacterales bacterium]|jgi:hypothetical protein|nr:hypothetical protein [Ktedonobacterales bacterium]